MDSFVSTICDEHRCCDGSSRSTTSSNSTRNLYRQRSSAKTKTPTIKAMSFQQSMFLFLSLLIPLSLWGVFVSAPTLLRFAKTEELIVLLLNSRSINSSNSNRINDGLAAPSRITKNLSVPLPVIVVGFPKSGTTSIWNFFNCSGIFAQHYCSGGDTATHPPCRTGRMATCILRNLSMRHKLDKNRTMLQGCGDYQVFAQIDGERPVYKNTNKTGSLTETGRLNDKYRLRHFLPQHSQLDELHRHAPHATYLLPLRPASEWADSVIAWFQMKVNVHGEYRSFNESIGGLPRRPGKMKDFLVRIYDEHTALVREFVRTHATHKLVEVNIGDAHAGKVMAESFGLNESCWGHYNKLEEHDRLIVNSSSAAK